MGAEVEFAYPSSWVASIKHWWRDKGEARQAEVSLLKRGLGSIPLIDARMEQPAQALSADTRTAVLRHVKLSGHKDRFLNVLEVGTGERTDREHVLVHLPGYGGGLAFSFQNIAAMSSVPGTRLFAMDWLGQGLSGRPKFPHIHPIGKGAAAVRSRVQQAEDFSIDALEEWRETEKINKMTLMCHSLGGYLSAAYALKYPDRVHKLILLSPVGVPEAPYELPDASESEVVAPPGLGEQFEKAAEGLSGRSEKAVSEGTSGMFKGPKNKAPSGIWARLWEANISPFGLVRASTFLGPKFVSRYAAWRYSTFENDVQKDLFGYLYTICREKGSGEYTMPHLLAPGAFARWPLIKRMQNTDLPVTCLYGESDWMRPEHGQKLIQMLKERVPTSQNELQRKHSKVVINPHSGHWARPSLQGALQLAEKMQVFLENPEGFNSLIVEEIKQAVKDHGSSAYVHL